MGRNRVRPPSYRLHKASGQAIVSLNGRQVYLGPYGTDASKAEYDRVVAEWLANGRRLPGAPTSSRTVSEVVAAYLQFAQGYYRKVDGTPTPEIAHLKGAAKVLRKLYGHTQAADFGPLSLKACREAFIAADQARKTVNQNTQRLKRIFKWAVENELAPAAVYHGLQAVAGLRRGRSEARETTPVRPVPRPDLRKTRRFLSRTVRLMIDIQLLTGARPGEVVRLRPTDLDMSEEIWTATLAEHKTAHHGKVKTLYFGPRAQKLLRPLLIGRAPDFPLFSPRDAVAELFAKRLAARKTPPTRGNRPGTNRKRRPKRKAREAYTTDSYRRAIERACEKGNITKWTPHRLRHRRGTDLRKKYGLDVASVILGESSLAVTQTYAEADRRRAIEVMLEIG